MLREPLLSSILHKLKKAEGTSFDAIATLAKNWYNEAADRNSIRDIAGCSRFHSVEVGMLRMFLQVEDLPRTAETLANMGHCVLRLTKLQNLPTKESNSKS